MGVVATLQGATKTTVTYDNNGNPTTENVGGVTTGFVYDNENRLTKRTDPDGSIASYTYQGDGLRRTRQEPGKSKFSILWDGSDYLGEK